MSNGFTFTQLEQAVEKLMPKNYDYVQEKIPSNPHGMQT